MSYLITLIQAFVLLILLCLILAGGVCVASFPTEPAAVVVGLISMLTFSWPAWLLIRTFRSRPAPKTEPERSDPPTP
ncbi:MAG TPA: hypothetical protein PLN96_09545 [Zoogloea sp.]|uniref:hypothetical protein n=1 Tax=Zoogloea sp. TaxID=49181 RepID=UPI002BC1EFA7|nr:hypothetical protein [Zoogloea sp.]HMV17775.1 hypothetical protein [Rhodocyclaceae bacterium]HMV63486.1 hypothetical protein [Rhodocyclaceae bacterium]HMW52613.1 hypothetical protein [Rhodocyclaceae bacterium]HMY48995.1 hypothetical protein [Rhodocyclaceae bacterium]HMZ75239.1 hypothetical protein [Rhodocyclaceae bacterium]